MPCSEVSRPQLGAEVLALSVAAGAVPDSVAALAVQAVRGSAAIRMVVVAVAVPASSTVCKFRGASLCTVVI